MTMTNAQAALQAAASVYSGGRGHTVPTDVTGMAARFKAWLDQQERQAQQVVHEEPLCSPRNATPAKAPTLWTVLVRPRNSNADWRLVKVTADSADAATSHLLAVYPGHAWAELTDTGEAPVPKPGPSLCTTVGCQRPNGHQGTHQDRNGQLVSARPGWGPYPESGPIRSGQ